MRITETLERASSIAERPVRSAVKEQRFNPLPHAGTISVVLLAVVTVTGLYLTLFFEFGFEASYHAVAKMQANPIQRTARGIHRFSSAALVLTTVVHAWRIFAASRFSGPRRHRWLTGLAALVLVWLAGVTGYWLIWDLRAQALTEATGRLLSVTGAGRAYYVRTLAGPNAGSGWKVLLAIWLAHLFLTLVIGYFTWRHLRRSKLASLPPLQWTLGMIAALVVAAIALPLGMLDPADPSVAGYDLPLDPFVMFLLPPLLAVSPWLVLGLMTLVVVGLALVPKLFAHPTPVVVIDEAACTGCDLCVIDCPYDALSLVEAEKSRRGSIAVVDASACVGCGICVGSCSFGAMELPGFTSPERIDPEGHAVVIACQRHLKQSGTSVDELGGSHGAPKIVEVACTGMIHPQAIGSLLQAGASGVQIVGCPPGDCAYGIGNQLIGQRLHEQRAPHIAARYAGIAVEDYLNPVDLRVALEHPGTHAAAADGSRRGAIRAGVLVAVSVLFVAFATWAPFRSGYEESGVRVLVDHQPGRLLAGQLLPTGVLGATVEVEVLIDGLAVGRKAVPLSGSAAVGVVQISADPGPHEVVVQLLEGSTAPTVVYTARTTLDAGRWLAIDVIDEPPPPGVDDGQDVFTDASRGGCGICHSTDPGDDGVGPSLAGVGTRAAKRIPGLDADTYLRESVLDPDAYVVEGYRPGLMQGLYSERLSEEDVDALVLYLLSLTGEEEQG